MQLEVLISSANIIDTSITYNDKSFFISYTYGVPQRENITKFWEEISTIGAQRTKAWLRKDNFMSFLTTQKKVDEPLRWEGSYLSFLKFVSRYGLWNL